MKRLLIAILMIVGIIAIPSNANAMTTQVWGLNFDHWYHLTTGNRETYSISSNLGWSVGGCAGACNHLVFQSDCNLVEYTPAGHAVWASNTAGLSRPCTLQLQTDANVVIYDSANHPHWATGQTWGSTHSATFAFYSGGCLEEWESFNTIKWRNFSGCNAV